MRPAGGTQNGQVIAVRGQDEIAVVGKHDECCVDDLRSARPRQESAGVAAEGLIDRHNDDGSKEAGKHGLSRAVAPDLSDDATVRDWYLAGEQFAFQ